MKNLIFGLLFSFSAFAAQDCVDTVSTDDCYDLEILTATERQSNYNYLRVHGFDRLEIVRKGTPDQVLFGLIQTAGWESHVRDIDQYHVLQLRDFDIKADELKAEGTRLTVPFVISLFFQLKGLVGYIEQGTLDISGFLEIDTQAESSVQVHAFGYSQWTEDVGAFLGIIDEYGLEFAQGVTTPLLENYFSSAENRSRFFDQVQFEDGLN